MKCDICGSSSIEVNNGQNVCRNCGLVFEEKVYAYDLPREKKDKIYKNSEIDMSLEEYLQAPDVDYSIIKVRYDCPIPDSLRENIIK